MDPGTEKDNGGRMGEMGAKTGLMNTKDQGQSQYGSCTVTVRC